MSSSGIYSWRHLAFMLVLIAVLTLGTAGEAPGDDLSVDDGATYNLTGNEIYSNVFIGSIGNGTLNQDDYLLTVQENMLMGLENTGDGAYNLNGGSLQAGYEIIGFDGTGVFTHRGGANTVAGPLSLGTNGTYNLNGDGSLAAEALDIAGAFNHSGGGNVNVQGLELGASGGDATYNLSGTGSLQVDGMLVIGDNNGAGIFNHSSGINLSGDLYVGHANNGAYNLSGTGSLRTITQTIGLGELYTGTFNQSGGANTVINEFSLGGYGLWGGNGTYNLSGGSLTAAWQCIGPAGTGDFVHNGGSNTANNILLGGTSGGGIWSQGVGTYELNGAGSLSVNEDLIIASNGAGIFFQSGGANTVSRNLTLSLNPWGVGNYTMTNGLLSVRGDEVIGGSGDGTFFQTGGAHTVAGSLTLAADNGSAGFYRMISGSLSANTININQGGTFHQTGGTVTLSASLGGGGNGLIRSAGSAAMNDNEASEDTAAGNGLNIRGGVFIVGNGGKLHLGGGNEIKVEGGFFRVWELGTVSVSVGAGGSGNQSRASTAARAATPAAPMGIINLSGTLALSLAQGYEPKLGDSFPVLTFGSCKGDFMKVTGENLGGGLFLKKVYAQNSMTLVIMGAPNPALYLLLMD